MKQRVVYGGTKASLRSEGEEQTGKVDGAPLAGELERRAPDLLADAGESAVAREQHGGSRSRQQHQPADLAAG